MSFATPIALALAALAVPILVLYILKVRMRRLPVSTNLFWRQIYDEKPPRSIWQNLRHILSLLAQLAFLCMLVLAIADPYLPWQLLEARRIVLVVDNSASMQASDVEANRLEAAKAFAQNFIDGLRERDELAVVVAGSSPEVVVGMTGHVPTLRRAIESISSSDQSTSLDPAIRLGRQLVGDHPQGQVIVLTDGCVEQVLQGQEQDDPEIVYQIFGEQANNVGITQFQVRRSLTDPLGYEILAAVMNASEQPVRCRLEVTLDEAPIDVVPLKLAPGESWKRSFEKTSIKGGILLAELTKFQPAESATDEDEPAATNDAEFSVDELNRLAVDDRAWALLPSRKAQKVLMVTPGNLFLRKVFEANPLVELTVVDAFPDAWPADSLIVLHQKIPDELPAGNVFVLDPASDCNLWTVSGNIADPIVTEQAEESPLMTHIRMDNVVVPQSQKLNFKVPVEMLAGTVSGDPIYAQAKRENGKCLVLLVNLEQSDLAFRTSFPILVSNALNWFAGQSGQLQPSLATGSLVEVELSSDSVVDEAANGESLVLYSPEGERTHLAGASKLESCTIGPLRRTGVWSLLSLDAEAKSNEELWNDPEEVGQRMVRQFAVNVANERESNLMPEEKLLELSETKAAGGRWLSRPIWFYLALLAGLFAGLEWFMYQRRLIS